MIIVASVFRLREVLVQVQYMTQAVERVRQILLSGCLVWVNQGGVFVVSGVLPRVAVLAITKSRTDVALPRPAERVHPGAEAIKIIR